MLVLREPQGRLVLPTESFSLNEVNVLIIRTIRIKLFRSCKSKENIYMKEDGPGCTVSDNKPSSIILNK